MDAIGVGSGAGVQVTDAFKYDGNDIVKGTRSGHSPVGMSTLQRMMVIIAEVANDLFEDIMGIALVMSTGEGIRGIQQLADMGIKIDDTAVQDMLNSDEFTNDMNDIQSHIENNPDWEITYNKDTMMLTYTDGNDVEHEIDLSDNQYFTVTMSGAGTPQNDIDGKPTGEVTYTFADLSLKLINSESILQNPGTLFYIQQVLQQMKDSLQAVTAVGKVSGDAASQASQTFARDVAQ